MTSNNYQLFAMLCESITEASTSIDLIKGMAGGDAVIQKLHKEMGLSHDQEYNSIDKISWSELKDSYKGKWVILRGTTGVGAIKSTGNGYKAVASNGGEVQTFSNDRGGNILDFLKGIIGKTTKMFTGSDTGSVKDIQKTRAKQQAGSSAKPELNQEALLKKFKPLWLKAIRAAQADVKGMVANMIKNDAFEKAKVKLNLLAKLDDAADMVETGSSDTPSSLNSAISAAVTLAAGHYYPDLTGEITRGRYGDSGLIAANSQGTRQILQDIASGDQKKLGTVLGFFKRTLITG
jgi:hypothetical protein